MKAFFIKLLLVFCLIILLFISKSQLAFANNAAVITVAPQLTLQEAILLALRYNPNVQNAEIQRIADKFNLRLAQWNYQLQYSVTGSGSYAHSETQGVGTQSTSYNLGPTVNYLSPIGTQISTSVANNYNTGTGATGYSPGVTLNVTQPLLQGFGTAVTLAPLHNAIDQEVINKLNLKNAIMQLITQVINQYAAVVQAENTLQTQKLALAASLAAVNQYNMQIKAGHSAPADIVQFQSTAASQQLAVEQQIMAVQQARLALLQLLGLNPQAVFSVTPNVLMDNGHLPTLEQSIQLALSNNIAYQQQQYAVKILHRQLLVARDQERWQLNATLSQTWSGNTNGNFSTNNNVPGLVLGQSSTTVGLQLNIPIDNVSLKAQAAQADVSLRQGEVTLAALKRQVIIDTTNAYNMLISQKQQITQAENALQLAQLNLNDAYLKLKFGRSTPFEVSSLQMTLTNAQMAVINTKINYVNSLAAFEQVLGTTLHNWHVHIRY
jgi:outer membrane protein TolC